ncbi:MAG: hypothetical protein ACRDZ3_05300, partial [Acidimicrobiia bacterium]
MVAMLGVALLGAVPAEGAPITAPPPGEPARMHVVQLRADPVATYGGEVSGYAATSPRVTGRPLDPAGFAARR